MRRAANVAAGDEVDVALELDEETREVVVPDDFAEALAAVPAARAFFDGLSYSQRRWIVVSNGILLYNKAKEAGVNFELYLAEGRGQT